MAQVLELAVPALVQGALQARLDRLDPKTREVVNIAAVIGRTFGQPLLERLVPHDELAHALTELQRLDLIVEVRRRPHPEYRFRHWLVQEVAYASLVQSKRKKLHHKVGDALEELFEESPEQAYGLLARNFEVADVPEKAVEYLLKAGDAARAIYADQEALPDADRLAGVVENMSWLELPPTAWFGWRSPGARSRRRRVWSDLDLEPQVHLAGHLPPADPPVVQGRLVQDDEDVGGGGSQPSEVADQRLVQAALGLGGTAGEQRDLDQDEVIAAGGWQLEVVAGVLHDTLHPVVVRDSQGLHKGGVRGIQERPLLGC